MLPGSEVPLGRNHPSTRRSATAGRPGPTASCAFASLLLCIGFHQDAHSWGAAQRHASAVSALFTKISSHWGGECYTRLTLTSTICEQPRWQWENVRAITRRRVELLREFGSRAADAHETGRSSRRSNAWDRALARVQSAACVARHGGRDSELAAGSSDSARRPLSGYRDRAGPRSPRPRSCTACSARPISTSCGRGFHSEG